MQRILESEVSEKVGALLGEGVARVRVEPSIGRADARLVEMAREEQSDLVVTGTHQRHGLSRVPHPSISRGVLRDAPMSVVCIPAARVETIERQSALIPGCLPQATSPNTAASRSLMHTGRYVPVAS